VVPAADCDGRRSVPPDIQALTVVPRDSAPPLVLPNIPQQDRHTTQHSPPHITAKCGGLAFAAHELKRRVRRRPVRRRQSGNQVSACARRKRKMARRQ